MMMYASGGVHVWLYSLVEWTATLRSNRLESRVKIWRRGRLDYITRRGKWLASGLGQPAWGDRAASSGGLSVSALVPCLLVPSRVFWCVLSSWSCFVAFRQFNPCFLSLWIIPIENSNSPKLMKIVNNNLLCFYWWSFSCTKLTVCDRW
jgi:hypothetical protein